MWEWATQTDFEVPAVKAIKDLESSHAPIMVVDFRAPSMRFWPHTFPFTPAALFNKTSEPIPLECGPVLSAECKHLYANTLQHGNDVFHELVTVSLTHAVHELFLREFFERQVPFERKNTLTKIPTQLCFGTWGLEIARLPSSASSHIKQLVDIVQPPSEWYFGEPFAKGKGKVSLFTNTTAGALTIRVPHYATNVSLSFVGHSAPQEVVHFRVHKAVGAQVSTSELSTGLEGLPGLRVPLTFEFCFNDEKALNETKSLVVEPFQFASSEALFELIRVVIS